ncbi:MAG: hypothetical protein OXI01_23180 [Albidovulum sp.]|nr:hypothetical protein [Albidovulum sp.]
MVNQSTGDRWRTSGIRKFIRIGVGLLLGVTDAVLLSATFVVALHQFAPPGWRWLDEEELSTLRTLLFGGTKVSAISAYLNLKI